MYAIERNITAHTTPSTHPNNFKISLFAGLYSVNVSFPQIPIILHLYCNTPYNWWVAQLWYSHNYPPWIFSTMNMSNVPYTKHIRHFRIPDHMPILPGIQCILTPIYHTTYSTYSSLLHPHFHPYRNMVTWLHDALYESSRIFRESSVVLKPIIWAILQTSGGVFL